MTTLNLTVGNPTLARIKTIKSPNKYANVTVGMLATAEASDLLAISNTIFSESITNDDVAVTIQFDNGAYKRSYAPTVYNNGGKLAVKFGKRLVEFAESFGNADVRVAEITLDKYADVSLELTLEVEDDTWVVLPLPMKLSSEFLTENKNTDGSINLTKLNGWLKKGQLEKLAAVLMTPPASGSSSSAAMVPLTSLVENQSIKVISSRAVNASYGVSYILTVQQGDSEPVQIWSPYSVKEFLSLGALVTADTTMVYQNYTNNKGQIKQSVQIDGLAFPEDERSAHIDLSIFA